MSAGSLCHYFLISGCGVGRQVIIKCGEIRVVNAG